MFECGLVSLCMPLVYGPMADTVEVKLPICKYIYIHTVIDLIWTDQWIDIIESVDVLIHQHLVFDARHPYLVRGTN